MRVLPILAIAAFAAVSASAQPTPVKIMINHFTSNAFTVVVETKPKIVFKCKIVPQGGTPNVDLKVCEGLIAKGSVVKIRAHRHFLKKLPSGLVDVPVANSEWTNACAGTKGEECVLKMDSAKTAEMKFKLVN